MLRLATASGGRYPIAKAAPTTQPQPAQIRIDNFAYVPQKLTVAVGTKVTWTNADDVPHTATSMDDPQTFDSGPVDTDETFSFTFTKAGTYSYYCKVHPHMKGTIVVQ